MAFNSLLSASQRGLDVTTVPRVDLDTLEKEEGRQDLPQESRSETIEL